MHDVTKWLDEDYDRENGFRLLPRPMPCCGASLTLNDLTFHPQAAFAKFAIEAKNPRWVFADDVPSAPAIEAMSEAYGRTGVMDEQWRKTWRAWADEVNAGIDRLAERVGEALGAPVRVVHCNL
jgi:hypothetical protein